MKRKRPPLKKKLELSKTSSLQFHPFTIQGGGQVNVSLTNKQTNGQTNKRTNKKRGRAENSCVYYWIQLPNYIETPMHCNEKNGS